MELNEQYIVKIPDSLETEFGYHQVHRFKSEILTNKMYKGL